MSIVSDVAITHLVTRTRQSLVSVLGVALGVGFFIGASSMLAGSQKDFIDKLVDSAPHVQMKDEYRNAPVQPVQQLFQGGAVALRGLKPKDTVRGIRNGMGTVEALSRLTGVQVAPGLTGQLILHYGAKDVATAVTGIDPDRERRVSKLESNLVAGRLSDLRTVANGIILGTGLAHKLGLAMGDLVTATSPTGTVLKMKVAGLMRTGNLQADDSQSFMLLRKAQVLLDRPNVVNQIRMRLDDVNSARTLAARIEARYGYRTESWQEANEDIIALLTIRNIIMYTIVGAILVVASFGIFNVISTVVYEKTRDIAILKSMGFSQRDVLRIFLLEGLIVGLIGTLAGWAIGTAIIIGMGSIELHLTGMTEVRGFVMDTSPFHYLVSGGFAILSSTFAAFLPARKAARLKPVDILRGAA